MNTKDYYRELDLSRVNSFAKRLVRQIPVIRKIILYRDIDNCYLLEFIINGNQEQRIEVRNALDSLIGLQEDLAELYVGEPKRDVFADWQIYVTGKYRAQDLFELQKASKLVLYNASAPDPEAFVRGLVLETTADGEIVLKARRGIRRALNAELAGFHERTKEWNLLKGIIESKKDSIELTAPAAQKMLKRVEDKLKTAISKHFGVDVSEAKLFVKVPGRKATYKRVFNTERSETRSKDEGERELDKIFDAYENGEIDVYEAREQIGTLLAQGVITRKQAELAAESLQWAKTDGQL